MSVLSGSLVLRPGTFLASFAASLATLTTAPRSRRSASPSAEGRGLSTLRRVPNACSGRIGVASDPVVLQVSVHLHGVLVLASDMVLHTVASLFRVGP